MIQPSRRSLVKSVLLLEDVSQNPFPFVAEIFSSQYQCDCFFFGTRELPKITQTSAAKIIKKIKSEEYDAIILGCAPSYWNPRKPALRNVARFLKRWPEAFNILGFERIFASIKEHAKEIPFYVIDLLDCPVIDNSKFRFLKNCSTYFKRELSSGLINSFLYVSDRAESPDHIMRIPFFSSSIKKLHPISVGISDEKFETLSALRAEKKIDLFFSGNFTNRPIREIGRAALQKLAADGFRIHISGEIYPEDVFYDLCAQSLICWSPDGFGSDCFRHYEIAACGSVPLRKHSSIFQYAPFRENEECLYYMHEGSDIYAVARKALGDPNHLRLMGRHAQSLVNRFHRYSRLAEYVLTRSPN